MKEEKKQVWTRIGKILADSRILDRITEIEIAHTNVSYHDAIVQAQGILWNE